MSDVWNVLDGFLLALSVCVIYGITVELIATLLMSSLFLADSLKKKKILYSWFRVD